MVLKIFLLPIVLLLLFIPLNSQAAVLKICPPDQKEQLDEKFLVDSLLALNQSEHAKGNIPEGKNMARLQEKILALRRDLKEVKKIKHRFDDEDAKRIVEIRADAPLLLDDLFGQIIQFVDKFDNRRFFNGAAGRIKDHANQIKDGILELF